MALSWISRLTAWLVLQHAGDIPAAPFISWSRDKKRLQLRTRIQRMMHGPSSSPVFVMTYDSTRSPCQSSLLSSHRKNCGDWQQERRRSEQQTRSQITHTKASYLVSKHDHGHLPFSTNNIYINNKATKLQIHSDCKMELEVSDGTSKCYQPAV